MAKKVLAKLLVLTMLFTSMVSITSMAASAEEAQASSILFEENFEKHTAGNSPTVYNNLWNIDPAGEGDSVTVENDGVGGSKAMKIVHASETAMSFYLNIPDVSEGKFMYSFKFRAENDSRYISNLGSLRSDNDWYGIVSMNSKVSNFYVGSEWLGYIANESTGISDEYCELKVFVDASTGTYTVYNGTREYSGSYSTSDRCAGRITFEIQNNSSMNGVASGAAIYWVDDIKIEKLQLKVEDYTPEEATDVLVESDISVKFNTAIDEDMLTSTYFAVKANETTLPANKYTITSEDNTNVKIVLNDGIAYSTTYEITVSKEIAAASSNYAKMKEDFVFSFITEAAPEVETIVFEDDFEDYEVGVQPTAKWSITASGTGDSVTVENDEVGGSKALKVVSKSTETISFNADTTDVTSGKIMYSFKFRAENDSREISKLGALRSGNDWYGIVALNSKVGWAYVGSSDKSVGNISDEETGKGTEHEFKVLVDATTGEYKVYYDGTLKYMGAYTNPSDKDVGRIDFEIKNGSNGVATGDAIYWIDDVKIEVFSGIDFTVSKDNAAITSLKDCAGDVKVDISFTGIEATSYTAVVAAKDESGKLRDVSVIPQSEFTNNAASTTITLPEDVTGEWNIEVYLLDSMSGLVPLANKAQLKNA